MVDTKQREPAAKGEMLYERFIKPLEAEHWGEYVVVAPDGRSVLAPTLRLPLAGAAARLGAGTCAFRIGTIAVAGWHVQVDG